MVERKEEGGVGMCLSGYRVFKSRPSKEASAMSTPLPRWPLGSLEPLRSSRSLNASAPDARAAPCLA